MGDNEADLEEAIDNCVQQRRDAKVGVDATRVVYTTTNLELY